MRPAANHSSSEHAQRGNALFLILIAVALFAALSYAITQSGRGGGSIDKETLVLKAGQMQQSLSGLNTAVQRMILTGTAASAITFDDTAETGLFAADGGGMTDTAPPSGIGGTNSNGGPFGGADGTVADVWGYKDVSDPDGYGYYIWGVGTDTDVSGRDAFAYLHGVSEAVCRQLNKGLGLSSDGTPAQTWDMQWDANGGKGETTAQNDVNKLIGQAGGGAAYACVAHNNPGAGDYSSGWLEYYHTLIAQ